MYYDPYTNQWVNAANPYTQAPSPAPVRPQQFNQPPKSAQAPTFLYVLGDEEARAAQLLPGTTAYMFSTQEPVAYIKEVDYSGKPVRFETYDLVKREDKPKEEAPVINTDSFVTTEQLSSVIANTKKELMESFSKEIDDAFAGISLTPKTAKSSKSKGE